MPNNDVFAIYNLIKPAIKKNELQLKNIINNEFKAIQYIKTTSMNENYMFNDKISEQFYSILNTDKLSFKKLIDIHVKCTNNFDSKDTNAVLLLLLARFALEEKQELMYHIIIQILTYKIYFPIYNNFFKFGVDESAFRYFAQSLPKKFDIAKYENIYDVVDNKSKAVSYKYLNDIKGNNASKLLLVPVHIKTRLMQFFKQLIGAYKKFLANNKVYINSSRELEDSDGNTFIDQERNDNSLDLEYRNRLELALIHIDLPDSLKYAILHRFNKSTKKDVDLIYQIIKYDKEIENILKIFIELRDKSISIEDKQILLKWESELGKYNESYVNNAINELLFKYIPDYKSLEKKALIEKRKIFITLVYLFFLKSHK